MSGETQNKEKLEAKEQNSHAPVKTHSDVDREFWPGIQKSRGDNPDKAQ